MSERMLCLYSLLVATFKCRRDSWRNFREGRLGSVQHHLGVVLIAREYNPCERCRIGASLISMALFTIEKADEFGSRYPRRLCHCAADISIFMSIRVTPYRKVKHKGK
jgi:hypothetical protein